MSASTGALMGVQNPPALENIGHFLPKPESVGFQPALTKQDIMTPPASNAHGSPVPIKQIIHKSINELKGLLDRAYHTRTYSLENAEKMRQILQYTIKAVSQTLEANHNTPGSIHKIDEETVVEGKRFIQAHGGLYPIKPQNAAPESQQKTPLKVKNEPEIAQGKIKSPTAADQRTVLEGASFINADERKEKRLGSESMSAGKKNDSFPFKPYDEGGDSEATTLNTDFKISEREDNIDDKPKPPTPMKPKKFTDTPISGSKKPGGGKVWAKKEANW